MDRQITSPAFAGQSAIHETKSTFLARLASRFRRRKKESAEGNPLTPTEAALIANLNAMR